VLEHGIGAQVASVVLVLVATGDLGDALGHQRGQVVAPPPFAPVGDDRSKGGGRAQRGVGRSQPEQAAVAGEAPTEEIDIERNGTEGGKRQGWCGNWNMAGHLRDGIGSTPFPYQRCAPLSLMNNPG
jgi:hypothetical protein